MHCNHSKTPQITSNCNKGQTGFSCSHLVSLINLSGYFKFIQLFVHLYKNTSSSNFPSLYIYSLFALDFVLSNILNIFMIEIQYVKFQNTSLSLATNPPLTRLAFRTLRIDPTYFSAGLRAVSQKVRLAFRTLHIYPTK